MNRPIKILAIDDEGPMLRIIRKTLEPEGFAVETFNNAAEGLKRLKNERKDIVISDLMMPEIDGFRIIEESLRTDNEIIVIVITAFSSIESAVKAMKLGAYDFIPKPFDPEHLLLVVKKAVENKLLRLENRDLRKELGEKDYLNDILGISTSITFVKSLIEKVKETDGNVLITGESGVGKELVTKAIHYGSKRRGYPFVPINCGALPDNLLESELFGYEKGAYTGAVSQKEGIFEMAHGGTVFLDEVGSISEMMQTKLLRFLEGRCFMRLGGRKVIQVDVRIIAATNEDLTVAINEGTFRKDLYYRLNVLPIEIPPLRERQDDIPLLTRHFIKKFSSRIGKEMRVISDEAMMAFQRYCWPGNVRELENTIERAITLTDDTTIKLEDLPLEIINYRDSFPSNSTPYPPCMSLSEIESLHIKNVLRQTNGNKSQAARILCIDYSTLLRKLRSIDSIS